MRPEMCMRIVVPGLRNPLQVRIEGMNWRSHYTVLY
jgi:hypothetical protein